MKVSDLKNFLNNLGEEYNNVEIELWDKNNAKTYYTLSVDHSYASFDEEDKGYTVSIGITY